MALTFQDSSFKPVCFLNEILELWMWERSFALQARPPPSHTVQDWRAADKRGYDLNHVFTDSYSQLFPEGKVPAPMLCVHAATLTTHSQYSHEIDHNRTMVRWPGACLENEVVNPTFDTIRIWDELTYQTEAGYFVFFFKSLSRLTVSTGRRQALTLFSHKMKFRRLEAYAKLYFPVFPIKQRHFWYDLWLWLQNFTLLSNRSIGSKRSMVNFPRLCSEWWGFSSNVNGWAAFHYNTSDFFSHIFQCFILCVWDYFD